MRVVYRTGGTSNYRWREVFQRYTNVEATEPTCRELARMGYYSKVIEDTDPMPTTYEGK